GSTAARPRRRPLLPDESPGIPADPTLLTLPAPAHHGVLSQGSQEAIDVFASTEFTRRAVAGRAARQGSAQGDDADREPRCLPSAESGHDPGGAARLSPRASAAAIRDPDRHPVQTHGG